MKKITILALLATALVSTATARADTFIDLEPGQSGVFNLYGSTQVSCGVQRNACTIAYRDYGNNDGYPSYAVLSRMQTPRGTKFYQIGGGFETRFSFGDVINAVKQAISEGQCAPGANYQCVIEADHSGRFLQGSADAFVVNALIPGENGVIESTKYAGTTREKAAKALKALQSVGVCLPPASAPASAAQPAVTQQPAPSGASGSSGTRPAT